MTKTQSIADAFVTLADTVRNHQGRADLEAVVRANIGLTLQLIEQVKSTPSWAWETDSYREEFEGAIWDLCADVIDLDEEV